MARFETLEPDWLPVDEALRRIVEAARPLGVEDVPLELATGRALARAVRSRVTLPPWDNSAMDGYAVRGRDIEGATREHPVDLVMAGVVRAGDSSGPRVEAGEAIRIMTGAPVPPGADTVVRVEDTDAEDSTPGHVRVFADRDAGGNVRPAGQDASAGELLLEGGCTIGSGQVAALASQGYVRVPVRRRPEVAILPTGDELAALEAFQEVREGRAVPESNGPGIAAAVREAGAVPRLLRIARDNPEAILARLDEARSADVLVTIGGASMGEADLLKRVLADRGYRIGFWRVRIRPGSPFGFGVLPNEESPLPVFGLPGNPASAFVTFQVLVRPFLLALAGHARVHRPFVQARVGEPLRSSSRLTHFFRVKLDWTDDGPALASLAGPQGSGLVRSLAAAQGLAVVPEGVEAVERGDSVRVLLLGDGPGWLRESGF